MADMNDVVCPECGDNSFKIGTRDNDRRAVLIICQRCGHQMHLKEIGRQIIEKDSEGSA